MTFRERYKAAYVWHEKVAIMEIFHLAMMNRETGWTIIKTADYFSVSTGLVSENLKLAQSLHFNVNLLRCSSRNDALKLLYNGHLYRDKDE